MTTCQKSDGHVILGLDPGSLRTGFGVLKRMGTDIIHLDHGTIVLSGKKMISDRLRELALDVSHLVATYKPHHAVVEDVFFFKNPHSALVLGQARGAILAVLGLNQIMVQTLSPTKVKSLVSGHGRAQKFQLARMVALELDIQEPTSEDASDALALALAYARSC